MNVPARLTPKGERTREHILDTALGLFISKGYHDTTMREIANTADCSLGLTYRYFARKEDLVLAFYRRLAYDLETKAETLPNTHLAARFEQIMQIRLEQIEPYRELFRSILGAVLSPQNELGVLGTHTVDVRHQEQRAFLQVVEAATDTPRNPQPPDLALLLYAGHLCLLLFWFYDRSPDYRATRALLALTHDMLRLMRRLLRLPPVSRALTRLAHTIEPVFGPGQAEQADEPATPHD